MGVGGDDAVAYGFEGDAQAGAFGAQELLGDLALGDVGKHAEDAHGFARAVADDVGAHIGEDVAAVFGDDGGLAAPGLPLADLAENFLRDGFVGEQHATLGGGVQVLHGVTEHLDVGAVMVDGIALDVADADGVAGALDRLTDAAEHGLRVGEAGEVAFVCT